MDAEDVREFFAEILPVRTKRLFGGLGVYDGDLIFALVFRGELYLKTSPETQERFAAAGGKVFTYEARSRERSLGYWSMPDAAFDDPDILREWTTLAIETARLARKPVARKPVRRRGSPPPVPLP